MSQQDVDEFSGIETTGHSWDGVKELNNPLPRWWVSIFYATVIWSIGYCILYPAWPMLESATKGVLGYSSRAEVQASLADLQERRAPWRNRIAAAELTEIVADDELQRFARRAGGAAFQLHCSQCHGSGAQGAVGYPNLNDDAWLWGGTLDAIHFTITHGVRNGSDDARDSEMPAFGEDLSEEEIEATAAFVLKLGGLDHDAAKAGKGAVLYEDNCSACHGEAGEGDPEQGAPKLADAIWLYAGDQAGIVSQIKNPTHGQMPGWGDQLDAVTIKELAVYVHTLGGGQ